MIKIFGKKRETKKRKQLISLVMAMMKNQKPLGATELKKIGVQIPTSSLYEHLDKLIERDRSRPEHQRLIMVYKTEDRVATRYCLTEKGKKMGYWLAKRNDQANQ